MTTEEKKAEGALPEVKEAAVQAAPVEQKQAAEAAPVKAPEDKPIDLAKTLNDFDARLKDIVAEALKKEVEPIKAEFQKQSAIERTGLSRPQYETWAEFKSKGLSDEQAMLLARQAKPDLFPVRAQSFDPSVMGQLAPGGESAERFGVEKNWEAEMLRLQADEKASQHQVQVASFESFGQKMARIYAKR